MESVDSLRFLEGGAVVELEAGLLIVFLWIE